jgi:dynein regulatry complex protein 1
LGDSDKILAALIRDGTEIITNVRVANDKREVDRRIKEAELRDKLLEKLELESGEATVKFDAITSKWSQLEEMKDPMGIFEGLNRQKSRIGDLMKQKDEIIGECRNELRAADERYTLSLEKQEIDVECLVDRIDNQIDIMKTAYREHLELLENTIVDERHTLQVAFNKKWESLFEKRGINEDMKIRKEKEMSEFYANELNRIALEHEEMTKSTRIRLDLDNQNLELELQKVKADVMLNSEKLDYNYQVLKRRENENVIIRNQQKRRLARLHDTIAEMKNKMKQTKLKCKGETEKLTAEIMKLHASIFDLEKKKDVLSEINDKKVSFIIFLESSKGRR